MKVLFICTGNVARSQEAAAFYNKLTVSSDAISAGTQAVIGKPIDPKVVAVMAEAGMDMTSGVRKSVLPPMAQSVDMVVSFVPLEEIKDLDIDNMEFWDVSDPRGTDLDNHRRTRDAIKVLVEDFIARHR